jgi:hypothetical protein
MSCRLRKHPPLGLMAETSTPRNTILDAIKAEDWIALKNISLLPRGFEAARQDAW